MAKIELNQLTAVLNEGAAVRLSSNASQTVEGETHVYFEPCEDAKAVTLSDCFTESTGRMLDVSMTLRNVCPGKRTAVGIAISEIDSAGGEQPAGFASSPFPRIQAAVAATLPCRPRGSSCRRSFVPTAAPACATGGGTSSFAPIATMWTPPPPFNGGRKTCAIAVNAFRQFPSA